MACRRTVQSGGGDNRRLSHCTVDRPSVYHFYKIILSTTLDEKKLLIPYKFVKKFRDELTDVVDFVIPNGRVWKVGLSKARNNIWFDDGWQQFAEYHSIGNGHFLLFGYKGLCSFSVFIFDGTASEIEYPCDDEGPSSDETFLPRNEVEMPDDSPPSKMLNSVILSPSSSSLKNKLSDASANKRDSSERPSRMEKKPQMKRSRGVASTVGRDLEHLSSRNSRLKVDQLVEIIDIDDNETKREKLNKHRVDQLVEIIDIDDNEPKREKLNKHRISEFDQPLAIKQESGRVKCETESSAEWEDKEVEIVAARKFKCFKATPKSERAMAAASKYMPKSPSFMVALRAYNHYNKRLYVPTSFSRYLSGADKNMKLQVDGREWEVHLYRGGLNRWDIGVGWSTFSTDNNLEAGDVCIFELLKNKEVLKVSIFRASEDGNTLESNLKMI